MSNMTKWAENELKIAGYDVNGDPDDPNTWLAEGTMELLEIFSRQGHSGFSAPYAIKLFEKLAMWKPIAPLTGADDEWNEVGNDVFQNNRNSAVFKNGKEGQAYWLDGRVFWNWYSYVDEETGEEKVTKSHYTNINSRIDIDFPWEQPEKPEYVFEPTEEFPNEEL